MSRVALFELRDIVFCVSGFETGEPFRSVFLQPFCFVVEGANGRSWNPYVGCKQKKSPLYQWLSTSVGLYTDIP